MRHRFPLKYLVILATLVFLVKFVVFKTNHKQHHGAKNNANNLKLT